MTYAVFETSDLTIVYCLRETAKKAQADTGCRVGCVAEDIACKFDPIRSIRRIFCEDSGWRQADSPLIRRSLKTDVLSIAKLRLADFEKAERMLVENDYALSAGKMTFGDALKIYRQRLHGDGSLKARTKQYREECISKLLRTWPDIDVQDVRQINKTACLNWAARLGTEACPSVFNHTVGTLKRIIEIAIEAGSLYDNPVRFIKRQRERPKQLKLPTHEQFEDLSSPRSSNR